jgi:hypothetical protein
MRQYGVWGEDNMRDGLDLAWHGFRHKLVSYLIMTLLVAFTVAGYLIVASYWRDATLVSVATAEPLNFPYLKTTVVYAYYANPPISPDEEFPPPRKYAPLFNETELERIRNIRGVTSLSVALSQECFSRYGHHELLSIEPDAPLWSDIDLIEGRLPQTSGEILVPESLFLSGATIGTQMRLQKPATVFPRQYMKDPIIEDVPDPEPVTWELVVGVYRPKNPMISGYIGYLPVNRVDSFPTENPRSISMDWPVPNTIFLGLKDPDKASAVLIYWKSLYRDLPGTEVPIIPPPKTSWMPDLPSTLMELATGEIAAPVYTNTLNAFGLGSIGIFAAMFTSFLDRRRELGIMKTVGMDDGHTAATVSLEVVFAGILGTLLGITLALVTSQGFLTGITGNFIRLPWDIVLMGLLVTSAILLAATYVPRAMARQGTVMELLHGRNIPIFRKRQTST